MDKISLRVYNQEIEGLISGGQLEEAIAHCHHILDSYSMHIETYRLIGKAYLESRRYGDATDIFQRVLNAVPDDFVAHVGMSIIRDDENKRDEAIWHMERAFEVQPSNPAIQNELRRLYGRRDGTEPAKIRLSRDALANMYAQGDLFVQAIAELRTILADDPNRPDLQVMLARAYMRAGQKVEAADVAAQLLRKYPYCMDALRVLVEVLPGTSRAENTQIYRQRLRMMDPYMAFATGSVFEADQVADGSVTLEKLVYKGSKQTKPEQPGWATSLGVKLEEDKRDEAQIEWLLGKRDQPPQEQKPQGSESPASTTGQDKDIPEFLRDAGWMASASKAGETQPAEGQSQPDESLAKAEMPDWLKSMVPAELTRSEEAPQESKSDAEEDLPAWLAGLGIATGAKEGEEAQGIAPFIKDAEITQEIQDQAELKMEKLSDVAPETEITAADNEELTYFTNEDIDELIPGTGAPSPEMPSVESSISEGEIPATLEIEGEPPIEQIVEAEAPPAPSPGVDSTFPDWLTNPTLELVANEIEEPASELASESVEAAEGTPPELPIIEESEPLMEISEELEQDALPAVDNQFPDWLSGMGKSTENIAEPPTATQAVEASIMESIPPELQAELDDQSLPEIRAESVPVPAPEKRENFPDWMGSLFATPESDGEGSKPLEESPVEEKPSVETLQAGTIPGGPQATSLVQDEDVLESVPSISFEAQEHATFPVVPEDTILEAAAIDVTNEPPSEVVLPAEHSEGQDVQAEQPNPVAPAEQSTPSPAADFPEWMAGLGAAAGVIGAAELSNEPPTDEVATVEDLLESPEISLDSTGEVPALAAETPAPVADGSVPQPVNIEDDTMAWLEGLAAKQGAKDEELISKPEDRPEQLPDWLKGFGKEEVVGESGSTIEETPKDQAEGPADSVIPPSFEALSEEVARDLPADGLIESEPAKDLNKVFEESAQPGEEASLNWLEDLEASHGLKNVDQEVPPDEGTDEFTDWLKGITAESEKAEETIGASEEPTPGVVDEVIPAQEPAEQVPAEVQIPAAEGEAKPAEIGELPAWLDEKKEETIPSESAQDLETGKHVSKLEMDFPDWMKEIQPPIAELKAENEIIPADLPEWMRKPEEPATESAVEHQIDEQEPGSWPPGESETPVVPEATAPEEWKPADQVTSIAEDAEAQAPEDLGAATPEAKVERPSVEATPAPVQAQDKDALLLADARGALEENEPTESMKAYSSLIRKNRYLEDTIQDLRKASERHPVDSIVWQTLGDAYMRAGRLQEALDAYTKAEELLG